MTKREVVRTILEHKRPPYVPWSFSFTQEARAKLLEHYATNDLERVLDNHLVMLGSGTGYIEDIGNGHFRDIFGAIWDRRVDKDIGVVANRVLPEPTLNDYTLPDPLNPRFFQDAALHIKQRGDCFRVFSIGFSLYERAWTLRGMENLMMDFYDNPQFVHTLFNTIADYNIAQAREALKYDIDAVYFGDDWGEQRGLQMGPQLWHEFIYPVLERMYGVVKEAGKFVVIHSCGSVSELFDDLIGIGLDLFNPFQPEVMDVEALLKQYRGRLSFFGGLSTQRTLPYGSAEDVRRETNRLIQLGQAGNYILSPAHSVEGDVPLENMLAFIEVARSQPGYARAL